MVVVRLKKRNKYQLPEFNEAEFLTRIDQMVKAAPYNIMQFVIDLFCGAGGTSEGIEQAQYLGVKSAVIIAGINHDKKAIYSQAVNHPGAYYTDEDIRFANLDPLERLVRKLRKLYPQCPIILWASLECTNHSNAKGGLSRDPDSRTLPWDLYRYIERLKPDGIWIENVKEFSEWGPMMPRTVLEKGKTKKRLQDPIPEHLEEEFYRNKIENGYVAYCTLDVTDFTKKKKKHTETETVPQIKPEWVIIKQLKGTYYLDWVETVKKYGYGYSHRILNAADFGAPTNRRRFFPIFMKKGWPISFPHPTHSASPKPGDMFDPGLLPHVPVKTCLDFEVEGRSIFEPGHIDSENTEKRILEGLIKFVAGGKKAYKQHRASGTSAKIEGKQIDRFLDVIYGNGFASSMERSAPTVRCKDGLSLVDINFLLNYRGTANSIEETSPTLMTKEKLASMTIKYFICRQYSGGGQLGSIDDPESALTTVPKSSLMELVKPWIMDTHFGNIGSDINETANVITANRKWSYLINPSWFGSVSSVENPSIVIVARQDKAPVYLVAVDESNYSLMIPVLETDSPTMIAIKEFMVLYNIKDIKKRMLMVKELLKIQSFPEDYYLAGGVTDQKKFIGNSVAPKVARAISESMHSVMVPFLIKKFKLTNKLAA